MERKRQWLTLVDNLVATLKPGGPLSFVLGAGASLSSGAPTTEEVEQQWLKALAGTFSDREALRAGITDLGDEQKINPIRPLFESVKPFIGYHCLAALGRDRPVLVLNLNWDDALQKACRAVDVPHVFLSVDTDGDLLGPEKEVRRKLEAEEPGVYCLHAHGQFENVDSSIRFGLYETLKFSPGVKKLLDDHFFKHSVVVVGASLRGDYDVIDLLRSLTEPTSWPLREVSPFYIFSRQEETAGAPSDGLMQNVLFSRKSAPNFRGDPYVDFDRLLLDLATRLKGLEFADAVAGRPSLTPCLEDLAIPSVKVLGSYADQVDRHAIVVEGDACIGKTNAGLLLAHLAFLCDDVTPEIQYHSGPKRCSDAMRAFVDAKKMETPHRVLIVEDPFGDDARFDPNPEFLSAFQRYLKSKPSSARRRQTSTCVIVTVRASKWRLATGRANVGPAASVRSVPISEWYEDDELSAYLQSRMANDALIRREIHKRELATPLAIREAISDTTRGREAMVGEKIEFLRSLESDIAWYVLLARLQELWPNGMSQPPLHRPGGDDDRVFSAVRLMLTVKELDGRRYVIPAHSADREAIDEFFAADKSSFSAHLAELERERGDPRPACALWQAIRNLRQGDLSGLDALPEDVQLDWGPLFMGEATRAGSKDLSRSRVVEILGRLRHREQSQWRLRELVFEAIRLWPLLRLQEEAQQFLDEVLADDERMGRYLVVEAMLYVQAATYPDTWDLSAYAEVWDKLAASRHKLLHQPDKYAIELAMLFDAFTWCPPRLEPNELGRWLEPLIEAANDCTPMAAAIQFSCFYHPRGAEYLRDKGIDGLSAQTVTPHLSEKDADAAAFMIRWHFIHQSRVRAMVYRRDMEPLHAHLISRIHPPNAEPLSSQAAANCERMVRALLGHPQHAGWAVHLAMSIATTRSGFDPNFVAAGIGKLDAKDTGLITGVLTYAVPDALVAPIVQYFSADENRGALLEALRVPPVVDGEAIGPPVYCAARPPREVYEVLRAPWTDLVNRGIPVDDEYEFLRLVHTGAVEAKGLEGKDAPSGDSVDRAVEGIVSGDLRLLEGAMARQGVEAGSETEQGLITVALLELARRIEAE